MPRSLSPILFHRIFHYLIPALLPISPATLHAEQAPVKPAVALQARAFPLAEVKLLDGNFKSAMELDAKYILSLDPDQLLHTFRLTAGLPTSAKPLGGWEAPGCGLRGHFTGHYLSACALMFESTGDPRFRERADKIISAFAECQKSLGTGYLSAFPANVFDKLEEKYGGVWAPYYTIHKIMAGLLEAHRAFGDKRALEIVTKMADYFNARMAKLTPEQIEKVLHTVKHGPQNEFGGMSEVLHDLYSITGRADDLKLANLFDRDWLVQPMASEKDTLEGLHANTHIPQAIGWWSHYRMTGEEKYRNAALFFWRQVTRQRSFINGSNSEGEHFFKLGQEAARLTPGTSESCNVYNILKLTRDLFEAAPDAELAEFYERALFNHILGSYDPDDGMAIYHLSLKPGHFKVYGTPLESFWCCTGTGVENHAKYGDSIYFHNSDALWVNLYIASELRWKEKGLALRQETDFPKQEGSMFTFKLEKPCDLTLNLRVPAWAVNGVKVKINGKAQTVEAKPQSYLALKRVWKDGDKVELSLPMSLRIHRAVDDPNTVAVLYGPVVLAGELGREGYPASDHAKGQHDLSKTPVMPRVPAFVDADLNNPASWIKPVEGKPLTFKTASAARPADVTLSPLYALHHQRFTVYWKAMTAQQWTAEDEAARKSEESIKAETARLAERMLDEVLPANPASEKTHKLQSESSNTGMFQNRPWRDATKGGWFSLEMKVSADASSSLCCTYWGAETGAREFDILVNDKKIASQKLLNNKPGEFFTVEYPIPADLTHGKQSVTVKIQALPGKSAGGFFGIRMLKAAGEASAGKNAGQKTPAAAAVKKSSDATTKTQVNTQAILSALSAINLPGERLEVWRGYKRHVVKVEGCTAWVVEPEKPLPGNPWAWCMEFPEAFYERGAAPGLLKAGYFYAHIQVGNTFGCPDAVKHFNAFYQIVAKAGLAKKTVLIGISRGGLYSYRWASENPEKVSLIYGDAPVCDFKSWPAGKGKGKGSKSDWGQLLKCYGFKDEAEALSYRGNPVDVLEVVAKAGIPLIHVVGDADDVVPVAENTTIVEERYKKLGGKIEVIHKPGIGHHPHGLEDPSPVVQFILKNGLK